MRRWPTVAQPTSDLLAPTIAGVLGVVAILLGWRGADWPAQVFRIELFDQAGFVVWNFLWYGGHHVLGYSVLAPAAGALVGPSTVAVASAVVAAYCFARLTRDVFGSAATIAAVWFAVGTVTNIAVGRITFGLGLAVGLGAALAVRRRHRSLAVLLALACPLASPVAGVFLAIAMAGWAVTTRRPGGKVLGAAMTLLALGPIVVLALAFPQGGTFRFNPLEFAMTIAICLVLIAVNGPRVPAVRVAAALYAAAATVAYVVPTPLGGNIGRFGMYLGGPLVACALWPARRVLLAGVAALALIWQWQPAVDGVFFAGRDPSSKAAYHAPLVRFLRAQPDFPARVEVPFTREHWESAYVATDVPIARGWERQLDRAVNPLFYTGRLTSSAYHRWLQDRAITYVALPDVALDPSARREARIISARPSYLEPVWHDEHWRVWRVVDAEPLASRGARVVSMRPDSLTLDARSPGSVTLRVRYTTHFTLDGGGCVRPRDDGWTELRLRRPGQVQLRTTLTGDPGRCP